MAGARPRGPAATSASSRAESAKSLDVVDEQQRRGRRSTRRRSSAGSRQRHAGPRGSSPGRASDADARTPTGCPARTRLVQQCVKRRAAARTRRPRRASRRAAVSGTPIGRPRGAATRTAASRRGGGSAVTSSRRQRAEPQRRRHACSRRGAHRRDAARRPRGRSGPAWRAGPRCRRGRAAPGPAACRGTGGERDAGERGSRVRSGRRSSSRVLDRGGQPRGASAVRSPAMAIVRRGAAGGASEREQTDRRWPAVPLLAAARTNCSQPSTSSSRTPTSAHALELAQQRVSEFHAVGGRDDGPAVRQAVERALRSPCGSIAWMCSASGSSAVAAAASAIVTSAVVRPLRGAPASEQRAPDARGRRTSGLAGCGSDGRRARSRQRARLGGAAGRRGRARSGNGGSHGAPAVVADRRRPRATAATSCGQLGRVRRGVGPPDERAPRARAAAPRRARSGSHVR